MKTILVIVVSYVLFSSVLSSDGVCSTTTSVSTDQHVIYTNSDYPVQLLMDIYYPSDYSSSEQLPCSIFVHGGLWQSGSDEDQSSINYAQNVVKATRTIVAPIQYRLTNDSSCCSTDHTCNLGINKCNGKCTGTYPNFINDTVQALIYMMNYNKCDKTKLFCLGQSAGGQICTDIAINHQMYSINELIGFMGIEGIYNLTKFYAGPKGQGWWCSVEKAFSSNGLIWCDNGDNACNPNIVNNDYSGPKGLFVHSPEDTLTLAQQGEEMSCRLNNVKESQCSCSDYYNCPCLENCLGNVNSNAQYTDKVKGSHTGVLNTQILANVTRDFICPLT